jgi:hypothetical protein
MNVIRNDQGIQDLEDEALRRVIHQRVANLQAYVKHFSELVRFVIAEEGDGRNTLEEELGVDLASRPPDVMEEVAGHTELVYVLSDDGSGVTLFLPLSMSWMVAPGEEVGRPT